MHKLEIYHFYNGSGGGVFSVIKNLLRFSSNPAIENHIIHAVNKNIFPEYTIEEVEGATTQQLFFYISRNNFYYTCKQLAKLLPNDKAIIVAHDWLELGMVSNLGLQNPVVYFLHGDYSYYYELAVKHNPIIDQFICVANSIENKLVDLLPVRKVDITYLRFPVPDVLNSLVVKNNFNIIFIGRLSADKGYPLLPVIAQKLRKKNIDIYWHIVGNVANSKDEVIWDKNIKVQFYQNINNNEVLSLLEDKQILVLPSKAEGMPVVVIEAMKMGVIPLVNDIDGGIQEMIVNNQTGFKIKNNDVNGYVDSIILLIENEILADSIRKFCIKKANTMFEPVCNTKLIEAVFKNAFTSVKSPKKSCKIYGSRLDQIWLPNFITKNVRKVL